MWALWTGALSSMNKYSFPSKYQTTTGHTFLSRMSMHFGSVDVAFNCSQSSNTVVTNTSPDHQTYLPFRARTNKMRVVLFVVFSPNVNTVVCTEHNLTFIWWYYFFPVVAYCPTSSLFTPLLTRFLRFPFRTTFSFIANLLLCPSVTKPVTLSIGKQRA